MVGLLPRLARPAAFLEVRLGQSQLVLHWHGPAGSVPVHPIRSSEMPMQALGIMPLLFAGFGAVAAAARDTGHCDGLQLESGHHRPQRVAGAAWWRPGGTQLFDVLLAAVHTIIISILPSICGIKSQGGVFICAFVLTLFWRLCRAATGASSGRTSWRPSSSRWALCLRQSWSFPPPGAATDAVAGSDSNSIFIYDPGILHIVG